MMTFSEEFKNLVKAHMRHSLCSTPISIQSRVYFDGEEISNLRSELPKHGKLTLKEVEEIWLNTVNNRPANDKRPIEWHFVQAIEERHGIK